VGGEEADERAGGGPADRVDGCLLALLGVEVARRQRQAGGGAGLIGAERGTPGEGQVEAERTNRDRYYPFSAALTRRYRRSRKAMRKEAGRLEGSLPVRMINRFVPAR
jgi:hypothetical protein